MDTDRHIPADAINFHTATHDLREFKSVQQMLETYPGLISEHTLRWVLRYRHDNGLDKHVTKLGKTLLIHVPGFTSWLMTRGD